jgi:4-amino-4-deoxy-L-arabinose transferase-like glycosyltransferase
MSFTQTDSPRPFWPQGLATFVDFAVVRHSRAVVFLVAVCLIAFLPGFFQIPPVDRDEARFAQATKQMIESGDYVDIRFQDEVRYKKPVGIYWLQAAIVKPADAIGIADAHRKIALYRIPSLLGAIGAVLMTYWAALALVSRRAAVLAGVLLAVSILLGVEARLAKTDAMLLFATTAAMGVLARVYLGQGGDDGGMRRFVLPGIFWTAMAAGILLKGPITLMVVGLTALALAIADRSWRWLLALRPVFGIGWMLLLVLPWFAAIIARAGNTFFSDSLGEDMLSKVVSAQESHGAPPGFFLLLFFLTFWPGSLLAALAAPAIWRDRKRAPVKFLLAWLIPSWIVFELALTKLPHYVLPLYPALAILIAEPVVRGDLSRKVWLERGMMWWFIAPALIGLFAVIALVVMSGDLGVMAWPFLVAALIFGLRAWWLHDSDGAERATLRAGATALLLSGAIYGVVLPSLTPLFPSVALAKVLRDSGCKDPVAAAVGFQEPSLVFLAGTDTQLTDAPGAAEFLHRGACRFAFVDTRYERSFAQRADAIGLRYAPGPRIDGVNISGGRQISIAVFRSMEMP